MNRTEKENYYLDIAETVLERGTCLRRNFGSIIVKNDEIVSSGYTGAPAAGKTALTPESAFVRRWGFHAANAMNCAALSTRRQTPSSALPVVI